MLHWQQVFVGTILFVGGIISFFITIFSVSESSYKVAFWSLLVLSVIVTMIIALSTGGFF